MNAARIASLTDEEIRILVSRIKGARKNMRHFEKPLDLKFWQFIVARFND